MSKLKSVLLTALLIGGNMSGICAGNPRGYVQVEHAYMVDRSKITSTDAAIVSDAYYSEKVEIIGENGEWLQIKTAVDGYPGWISKSAIYRTEEELFIQADHIAKVNLPFAFVYAAKDTEAPKVQQVPFEALLHVTQTQTNSNGRWLKVKTVDGRIGYIQAGNVTLDYQPVSLEELDVMKFTSWNLPYSWGGRCAIAGYDCSGFTQMLYRQMGVFLPRDSKDQCKWDGFKAVSDFNSAQKGDLIFFGKAEDQIVHVGFCMGNGEFVHFDVANKTGYIQVSQLSDEPWNGIGTHSYRALRRPIQSL